MTGKQQKTQQLTLALEESQRDESQTGKSQGSEPVKAVNDSENPAETERMMEEVCNRENLQRAFKRVRKNRGKPGIDKMTTDELKDHLKQHWPTIREQLLDGSYQPKPVLRVEIPKPSGGVRKLGIPCVQDRFVQQAIQQELQKRWDHTFSNQSYGFRPGRSQHHAISKAQQYIAEGYDYVVDMDLEKFFDRVNHDKLMGKIAKRIKDKRLLRILRSFLEAGILDGGLTSPSKNEGLPQGGPLSPILSNLYLDDLDRELERRGHKSVRYADDCNIYVKSERAGQRVLKGMKKYLEKKLKLKVNEAKSGVAKPEQRKFLGFSFMRSRQGYPKRTPSKSSLEKLKREIRRLTRRTIGRSVKDVIKALRSYLVGWMSYYGKNETPWIFSDYDGWIRRRLRSLLWSQWKNYRTRKKKLLGRGVDMGLSCRAAWQSCEGAGAWKMSSSRAMHHGFPVSYFDALGLPRLYVKRK